MVVSEASEPSLRWQLIAFAQLVTRSLGERDIAALMLGAFPRAGAGLGMILTKLLGYLPEM